MAAISNSLQYAAITMLISLIAGTLLAFAFVKRPAAKRWLDLLVMLPFGASAVTLGLGFIVAFSNSPLARTSFPWLVPLAHSLIAMPFVLRAVQPALASIPDSLRQSAAVLGATPLRVWWQGALSTRIEKAFRRQLSFECFKCLEQLSDTRLPHNFHLKLKIATWLIKTHHRTQFDLHAFLQTKRQHCDALAKHHTPHLSPSIL